MPESNIPTKNPHSFLGTIEINDQATFAVDHQRIRDAIAMILGDADWVDGSISVAIVDDRTIQGINKKFLAHDDATDVISFVLDADRSRRWLDGEIIASFETAAQTCADFGWPSDDELFLYIVHGALHLTGRDDQTDKQRAAMSKSEQQYLNRFGLKTAPAEKDKMLDPNVTAAPGEVNK